MPLMDHFRPPLGELRHWESFHATWAGELMASLNRGVLPDRYFAEAQVHVGGHVEVDVASFTRDEIGNGASPNGGVAVAVQTYSPPLTTTPAGTCRPAGRLHVGVFLFRPESVRVSSSTSRESTRRSTDER